MIWRTSLLKVLFIIATALCLSGCAGALALPGGDDNSNIANEDATPDDLLQRVTTMQPGMTEQAVFNQLHHSPTDFNKLSKVDILKTLYGSSDVQFTNGHLGADTQSRFLTSLVGYSMNFKNVKKEMGFSGLFRIRTDEAGYDYIVTLIFSNGLLYIAPVVTGGAVKKSSSKTLFEFLTPGMVTNRIK